MELVVADTTSVSIAEDTCRHPELIGITDHTGTAIQCTTCKKTALITQHTILSRDVEALAGIVGIVFGSQFGQAVKEMFSEYY